MWRQWRDEETRRSFWGKESLTGHFLSFTTTTVNKVNWWSLVDLPALLLANRKLSSDSPWGHFLLFLLLSFVPPHSLTAPPFTDNLGFLWKASTCPSSRVFLWDRMGNVVSWIWPGMLLLSDKSSYWRCWTDRAQIWLGGGRWKKMDGRTEERGEGGKHGMKERRRGELGGGASVTNKSCVTHEQASSFVFSPSDKQQIRFMCDVTISRSWMVQSLNPQLRILNRIWRYVWKTSQ